MNAKVYAPPRWDIREHVTVAIDPTRIPSRIPVQRRGLRLSDLADTRRRAGYNLWRTLTVALVGMVAAWDVAGLLVGGDAAYRSPSYDVLRLAPFGMRTYGGLLAGIVAVAVYGYGRHRAGQFLWIRVGLALLSCWYVAWLVAVAGTWVAYGEIVAWGAVGKLGFTAFVALTLARTTPVTVPDRWEAGGVATPARHAGRAVRR